jgi:serine/threonine-protein kinase
MARTGCLTGAELTALALGDLPEADLEEVIGHLETCPRCEAAARALDNQSDPLLLAIRHSAATRLAAGGLPGRIDAYEILGELGRGDLGVVYKARHSQRGHVVALKVLRGARFTDREERRRFRAEAEAVVRLQHPHIVQLFETGESADGSGPPRVYLTRELVDGGSLAERLAGPPLFSRQAAVWLEALARAAHHAHQQGILHRALKPSNVLFTRDGRAKISDFGMAHLLEGPGLQALSGLGLGTAAYLAPEQVALAATATPSVGPAADVYALGALLYTILTGRPPFQGASPEEILGRVRTQEPAPPGRFQPQLPHDLETICIQCLQKLPGQRYPSAADLADDLRRFLAGEAIIARPVGTLGRFWRWCRRRLGTVFTVALVMAP